jgi:aryl-alcohol dehydrogenase-like predicted oxidoreductase/histidinol phosphatase-like enzyme
MGAMRLSTEGDRDEARAVVVLHAAFDAGVTLVDTADAYCRDESDVGHNERLIAHALSSWKGDRASLRVVTKGGLVRAGGRWAPDGRARHLAAACAASRRALGGNRLFLYLLHAPDPRTPLATSVRALAGLRRDGLVEHVGLSNVTVAQIDEARRIVEVAAVEVELSVFSPDHLRSGVVAHCVANGIPLLAHRPLGGPGRKERVLGDPVLTELASRHGTTPFDVALAWLMDLSPLIVPIPGVTRVETARRLARALEVRLDDEDRGRLDARFPAGRRLRPEGRPRPTPSAEGEVVLVMGLPGAGKSTIARDLVARGHVRLNRDETGGRLAALLPKLDRLLASGARRVVLDNTYVSRKSRAEVVERAWASGLPVRCVFAKTSVVDAQINACLRMVRRYGRLLEPEEMSARTDDPGAFGPGVPFRYERQLEPPVMDEGFSSIEVVPFERRRDASHVNRAVILWGDGVLYGSRDGRPRPLGPEDVELLPSRREVLVRHREAGYRILALSWRPDIALGTARREDVEASFERTKDLLGAPLEILYCPHGGGPPVCWCRKPLPGLAVLLIERHRLDPTRCLYVGDGAADRPFAERLGFAYREARPFFAPGSITVASEDGSGRS